MEWPLPLWLVLREELAALRPPPASDAEAPRPQPQPAAVVEALVAQQRIVEAPLSEAREIESTKYQFSSGDVLDLKRLTEKLKDRRPDLIGSVPELKTLLMPAVKAFAAETIRQAGSQEVSLGYDADTLNRLLATPDLYKAFPDLPESQWIKEQIPEKPASLPESKVIELNRALLDRALAGAVRPADDKILPEVIGELHHAELSALCFSGGGIRSATFCLGVIQSLARAGLLEKFDYLSTVSGGGYVGGWLAAWTYWNPKGLAGVIAELKPEDPSAQQPRSKLEPEPDPVFYLRNFSNYLTPRTGLLSADTWALVAIYLRNLLLNWTVMLPILMAILAVPYVLVSAMRQPLAALTTRIPSGAAKLICFLLAVLFLAIAAFYEGLARPSRADRLEQSARPWLNRRGQGSFAIYFLAPLIASGFLLAEYIWHVHLSAGGAGAWPLDLVAYGGCAAILAWLGYSIRLRAWFPLDLVATFLSGILGGSFLLIVMLHSPLTAAFQHNQKFFVCLGPPTVLIVVLIAGTIFSGLATFWTDDEDREYWARMGAWVLIAALGWAALGTIALLGPVALVTPGFWREAWALGGALATAVTTIVGWSGLTEVSPDKKSPSKISALATKLLPILGAIAIVLILGALALAAIDVAARITALFSHPNPDLHAMIVESKFSGWMIVAAIGSMAAIGLLMSAFIDVNKYSLHAMYRNRLIRAYLGASRDKGERKPNPFTGFDPDDNVAMSLLWQKKSDSPRKLMPFVNITLNLVEPISNKLAWQERKAESFTVTPLHTGSFRLGYRHSADCASISTPPFMHGTPGPGITLGTATAISGAAVSPNMGYNSSPIVEILLSLLNVRLGWWLGNPGPAGNKTFRRAQPTFGIKYLADEAFGRTSDEKPYVYLSDGGHFENLGLYEMVLRRCHTIVVIDADADAGYTFDNLGNAIRKIRIDLGIPIDFPSFPTLAKLADGGHTTYCAVGKIHYDSEDSCAQDGNLIYVKPTMRGDEPADVASYEREHRDFPHESTADQWFTESQFESYRALGEYEIMRILQQAATGQTDIYKDAREILRKLK